MSARRWYRVFQGSGKGQGEMSRRHFVLAVICGAFVASATAAAAAPAWHWSESFAEKTLLTKLKVPCHFVRSTPADCSLAGAQAELASYNARIDACNALTDPNQTYGCLQAMIGLRAPQANINWVTHGFPLDTADCVGTGPPDRSGYRFRQFRCKVTVIDRDRASRKTIVSGRLLVTPTGKATFKWALI
jgi:hypothetical protein